MADLNPLRKLLHEINHLISAYRQLVMQLGMNPMNSDRVSVREDLSSTRQQCLKCCDAAKNCVLPQLKSQNMDSSDVTKQANQFISSVNSFIFEMKRCQRLLKEFTMPADLEETESSSAVDAAQECAQDTKDEMDNLSRDIKEAEAVLEALENAITVHFSSKDPVDSNALPIPKPRRRGKLGNLCLSCKTTYA